MANQSIDSRIPKAPGASPASERVRPNLNSSAEVSLYNYRRVHLTIVIGVFLLFFLADSFEHGILPRFNIGHFSWFFTTALATILAYFATGAFLGNLERVHNRLVEQNKSLADQAAKLAQQSERLALSVQEAHHRIKNNLQTVAALLSWYDQQGALPRDALTDSVARIRAIALVHDTLTKDTPLTEVDAAQVIEQIAHNVLSTLRTAENIMVKCDLEHVFVSSRECTSLALIVNELLLNAVEHAFPVGRAGSITITLHERENVVTLCVADDGVGLPPDFHFLRDMQTGLHIASSLVKEDLHGSLNLVPNGGTEARVIFRRRIDE